MFAGAGILLVPAIAVETARQPDRPVSDASGAELYDQPESSTALIGWRLPAAAEEEVAGHNDHEAGRRGAELDGALLLEHHRAEDGEHGRDREITTPWV